ncbi:hypothetical protein ANAEL_03710 [Anaerolineales bacterium]|nr:hypothetical protein ANAEL_03710 [Anaerolineales bacterium]
MEQWVFLALVPVVVGVVLLFVEYRTGWFAQHVRGKSAIEASAQSEKDWATTIYNVRVNLGKMYSINADEVRIKNWEIHKRGREVHLSVEVSQKLSFGRGATIDTYSVIADSKGRILKCERPYAIKWR